MLDLVGHRKWDLVDFLYPCHANPMQTNPMKNTVESGLETQRRSCHDWFLCHRDSSHKERIGTEYSRPHVQTLWPGAYRIRRSWIECGLIILVSREMRLSFEFCFLLASGRHFLRQTRARNSGSRSCDTRMLKRHSYETAIFGTRPRWEGWSTRLRRFYPDPFLS